MRTVLVATAIATSVLLMPMEHSHAERPVSGRTSANVTNDEHDVDMESAEALEWIAKAFYEQQWIDGVQRYEREVAEYVAGVQRWQAAQRATRSAPPSVSVSGDCAPVAAIIGWGIVNRESGGDPSKWNTQGSGAFGCSQTLITHYNDNGVCAGINPYTVDGQTKCTQILFDRGGLEPWRLTR